MTHIRHAVLLLILAIPVTLSAQQNWRYTGSMNGKRWLESATVLNNGLILVVGGMNETEAPLNTCELYDPATEKWTATSSMRCSRERHTATLLSDGRVVVIGGNGSFSGKYDSSGGYGGYMTTS